MKRTIVTLWAAAAIALVVAAFAASASADTVICSSFETPCSLNHIEQSEKTILTGDTLGGTGITIKASGYTEFECGTNLMSAKSKAANGNPLPATFNGSLSNCLRRPGGGEQTTCTGSFNSPPTTLEASATGGYMRIGTKAEPLSMTFSCASGSYSCTYKAKDTVSLNVQELEATVPFAEMYRSSGVCDNGSPWLSIHNITAGSGSKAISKYTIESSVLCKTAEEPCQAGNNYGAGTTLTAALTSGTKAVFGNETAPISCSSSTISGKTTKSSGKVIGAELTNVTFGSCNWGTVTAEVLPWQAEIVDAPGIGDGVFVVQEVGIKVTMPIFEVTCKYRASVVFSVHNEELSVSEAPLELTGGSEYCGPTGTWTANYGFSSPSPFFLTWS